MCADLIAPTVPLRLYPYRSLFYLPEWEVEADVAIIRLAGWQPSELQYTHNVPCPIRDILRLPNPVFSIHAFCPAILTAQLRRDMLRHDWISAIAVVGGWVLDTQTRIVEQWTLQHVWM